MTLSIKAIKILVKKTEKLSDGRRMYSEELKKMIIQFHYESGMSLSAMEPLIDIDKGNLARWKRLFGGQKTAYVHGRRLQNDVRTRCLAVRDYIEKKILVQDIAREYGCSTATVYSWVNLYKEKYLEYIDAPDGIPYIVKEKKMVYGDANVAKIRALLQSQAQQLLCMIDTMHMSGAQAEAMKKCAEETLNKEATLVEAATILAENGLDIK